MANLTCNNVRQSPIDTVLSDLNAIKDSLNGEQQYILPMLIEKPPSETTVWRWLKVLVFVYDLQKKILCMLMAMKRLSKGLRSILLN
jgi:hypothetical protein